MQEKSRGRSGHTLSATRKAHVISLLSQAKRDWQFFSHTTYSFLLCEASDSIYPLNRQAQLWNRGIDIVHPLLQPQIVNCRRRNPKSIHCVVDKAKKLERTILLQGPSPPTDNPPTEIIVMEKSRRQRYTTYFALSAAVTGCCSSFQPTPNVRWRHPPYIHWMPTPIPSLSTNAVVPYISPWSPIQKSGRFMSNTPSSMPSPQKKNPLVSSLNKPRKILIQGRRRVRPVSLQHERDFFRQAARLESMDSYLLVSTLTASMSFGALLGFCPIIANAQVAAMSALRRFWYQAFCSAIPVVAGFSAMFGLYATVMFSLTILYGKCK